MCSASNVLVATIWLSLFLTSSAFPVINALSGSTMFAVNVTVLFSISSFCENASLVGFSFKTSIFTWFVRLTVVFPSNIISVVFKSTIPAVSPAFRVTEYVTFPSSSMFFVAIHLRLFTLMCVILRFSLFVSNSYLNVIFSPFSGYLFDTFTSFILTVGLDVSSFSSIVFVYV